MIKKITSIILLALAFLLSAGLAISEVDISDRPLDVEFKAASTTVMFLLDDSGSMDFEFMTTEDDGNFDGDYYVFGHDNVYPANNNNETENQAPQKAWKAQWAGYNKIYYNPKTDYKPWASNGTGGEFPDAHLKTPKSSPMRTATFTLSNEFYSVDLADSTAPEYSAQIDQATGADDSHWRRLGETHNFNVAAGETWRVIIERTSNSNNYTIAPAVKFVRGTDETEITYNSGSPEYTEKPSNWSTYYGTRFTSEIRKAVYTFEGLAAGEYEIYFRNSTWEENADSNATYTVKKGADNSVEIKNSHYFLLDDSGGGDTAHANNGVADSGENIYLVNIDGSSVDVDNVQEADIERTYYRLNSSDGVVDDGELTEVTLSEIPEAIRPPALKADDLQNFANWYSFYRRRGLTAKASVGRVIAGLEGLSVGLYSIHERTTQVAVPVKITNSNGDVVDNTETLLTKLYDGTDYGSTPLRGGLEAMGKYYMGTNIAFGPSPYENADNGGSCQQVYTIAMTDGYWSDKSYRDYWGRLVVLDSFGDYGGHTGNDVLLADIAAYYYDTDLRSGLPNAVPTNACDSNAQQHMVTYGVSFGVTGTIDPADYDSCTYLDAGGNSPSWPDMTQEKHKVDDLFHAAVNSKGEFFTASNPDALIQSLKNIFAGIAAREITGSSVAVSTEKLYSSSHMFQGSYLSTNWTGEVESYLISYDAGLKGITAGTTPVWKASEQMATLTPDTRKIITYNPDDKNGSRFRWDDLSASQKNQLLGYDASRDTSLLEAENETGGKLVDFLRGSEDYSEYRSRPTKLGDIVHSSPVMVDDNLFVGANDGMLHVFDAATGVELFSYIPNLVYENLNLLSQKDYTHKFFVDQTPKYARIINEASEEDDKVEKYIIGGLGKGGKGYYCLNITDVTNASVSENTAKTMVAWEFTDRQMGYSYSEPVVVHTKSDDHPYIVIVGNGYNSPAGEGIFYILDLLTGIEITRFQTQVFDDNGVSSPIAIDVNNDYIVDYVYAGDLKGNLWKLDLTSGNVADWDFAFFEDEKPAPLFTTMANQPITSRPDVARHCKYHGYLVAFGTGKYLGISDLNTDDEQAMYAVWDYGDDSDNGECLGEFEGGMNASSTVSKHPDYSVDEIEISVRMRYQPSDDASDVPGGAMERCTGSEFANWAVIMDRDDPNQNQSDEDAEKPNPTRDIGWFLPMSIGKERIVQDPMIISGTLLFLSKVPVPGICSGGGYSMVYSLGICDGGALECAWSTPDRKELNMPVPVDTPDGEKLIFGKRGAGAGGGRIDKDLAGSKIPKGIYYWQEIVDEP